MLIKTKLVICNFDDNLSKTAKLKYVAIFKNRLKLINSVSRETI